MKHILLSLLWLLPIIHSYSQKFEYFDANNNPSDSLSCNYYQASSNNLLKIDTIKTYFCHNRALRSKLSVKDGMLEGMAYYYYPNGRLKEKMMNRQNFTTGVVTQFFANGRAKFTKLYLSPDQIQINSPYYYLIVNSWDSLGNPMVKNMEGYYKDELEEGRIRKGFRDSIWITYDQDAKKIFIEKFNSGAFVEGYRLDGDQKIHYDKMEIGAEPKGGMIVFYRHVGQNLNYPAKARRMGIQGKVFLEFVINRDGSLEDVKCVRGIGGGCDEEAIRVVKSAPSWNPGFQKGKPVRQKMVIPISFKLG